MKVYKVTLNISPTAMRMIATRIVKDGHKLTKRNFNIYLEELLASRMNYLLYGVQYDWDSFVKATKRNTSQESFLVDKFVDAFVKEQNHKSTRKGLARLSKI